MSQLRVSNAEQRDRERVNHVTAMCSHKSKNFITLFKLYIMFSKSAIA